MNKKLIILLTVFIDVLGIGIIIPVLPFYMEALGATPTIITILFAVYSFFSFFSGPFLGSWSDKIGRKPVLLISLVSTSLGWLIFALAPNVIWLFIGRIIDGLAAGNFPIAQSYLVDISKDEKEKTTNLGLIGACFGVGLVVGPAIGGLLSSWFLSAPFWFVGILALINSIMAYFVLPETNLNQQHDKKLELNPLKPLQLAMQNKPLLPSLSAWFFFGLALASQQSIFSLYLNERFGLGSTAVGLFMGGAGLIIILNQMIFKKFWLRYFSENSLNTSLMLFIGMGCFLMGLDYLSIFIAGYGVYTVTQSVLRATLTSRMTKRSENQGHGAVLGVINSVMSLSMIIGPIFTGWLFEIHNSWPFWAAAFFSLIAFAIIIIDTKKEKISGMGLNDEEIMLEEQKLEMA